MRLTRLRASGAGLFVTLSAPKVPDVWQPYLDVAFRDVDLDSRAA